SMAGEFSSGAGAFRGIPFNSAQSPFSFTNFVWRLPGLAVTRPEGGIEAEYTASTQSRNFYWRVHSQIDAAVGKPFLQKQAARQALELFQFTAPPTIDAQIRGRWSDVDALEVEA